MKKVWTLSLVLLLLFIASFTIADEKSVSYSTTGTQSGFSLVAPVTISESTSVTVSYDCNWQINYSYVEEGEVYTWKVSVTNPTVDFTAVNGSTFGKTISASFTPSANYEKSLAYFGLKLTGEFPTTSLDGASTTITKIGSLSLSTDYTNGFGNSEAIRTIRLSGGTNKNSTSFTIATVTFSIAEQ